jgi:hypothetical protein
MITDKQQAALSVAKQIDSLRIWTSVNAPQLASYLNQAISDELANQAVGFSPTSRIRSVSDTGFGDITDFVDATVNVVPNATPDLTNLTSTVSNVTSDLPSSGIDLSGLANLFGSAGNSADPLLSATPIATSPQSVSGIINNIGNTFTAAVRAIYDPQIAIAQAKSQIAGIQLQAEAAQLGVAQQLSNQSMSSKLLKYGVYSGLAFLIVKAMGGLGNKRSTTTTSSSRNY